MQLSDIQAFLAVVQTGSLSGAAESLFVTQPTLSHRIQSLEKELGYRLLERSKGHRHVNLTPAGRDFILIAEKWQMLWQESKGIASAVSLPVFRAAATQTLSNYVMPAVYARFAQRALPIAMEFYTLHYRECYKWVEKRMVDAVFVSRTMPSDRVSAIPVCTEKMVLLCRKDSGYPESVRPPELDQSKGIYMLWNHSYAMWHEYWFGNKQYRIYADNMKLVDKIIASSDMWAIVPISAARAVVQSENLRYLDLQDGPPERPIFLLTLEPQHECTRLLIEDLIHVMGGG